MTVPRCHFLPKSKWCDHAGPGDFMGHTCQKLELFDIIKANYLSGTSAWDNVRWTGYEPIKMAVILTAFAPYILTMYDCLFVETKDGPAWVTAISDEGIRIESLFPACGHEWIHADMIEHNGFVAQKTMFDRHPELKP